MSSTKAGRGKSTKVENNTTAVKQTKVDTQKITEKEKKQPSMEQVRLATLMSKEEPPEDLMEKVKKVKEITCKTDDEIMTALHDCDYNEENAIAQLVDEKATSAWSTTTKRKRKVATNPKTEAAKDNGGDLDGIDTWEKNGPYSNASQYPNRGYRANRRGGPRTPRDRGSFENRRWHGRGNTENGGDDDKPRGRYRGDGRMTNGPSRGRGGRGGRGSRGPGGTRMFQNRDRGGGFPREIDTWNNPETPDSGMQRQGNDDFPSPEDWDNEEYTGSLADTKVFTPSTPIEPPAIPTFETVATEAQDTKVVETQEIHTITIQNTAQNVTIPTMVVGSNQLTPAQSKYFNQLTQQSEQSRKQAALKSPPLIFNSTVPTIQQAFGSASISPGFASSSTQSYSSAIAASQQYPTVTQSSFQPKSSIPYTNRPTEFTSSNYNVGNYSSPLPPRPKPNAQSSVVDNDPGAVQSATSDMNSAIKFLGAQFSAMEFTNSEKYDPPEVKVEKTPPTLNNFTSINASRAAELPINYQSSSPSQASPSIASVLTKAKLTNESVLQGDNSIYSGTSAVTSRGANMQDLKNVAEVPSLSFHSNLTESASVYQPQQQSTAYQKTSTSYPNQAVTTYSSNYATSSLVTTSSVYQPASTGSVSLSFPGYPVTSPSITSLTMPVGNSVYHNSSFPSHGAVSNFQSYMSYPASVMQSYQGVPAGMAQSPYTGTQYGNGSLTSLGTVAYGAANAPYNSYGIDSNIPNTTSSHKISSSSNALSNPTKEGPQFPDNLDAVTTSSIAVTSISGTNTVSSSLVSGGTTSTTTKVTYSTSYTGSKAGGVVPSIPPGVAPIMGPQYIMSQSGMPIYPPTFVNYDDIYNMQRALPPHVHTGYLDLNYPAAPQTNLPPPATARDPFSSISDGRFSRPDNTTSPLPPTGQSLSQPNAAGPGHQQTMINPGLLQTYTAAYLYPYTQYSTPALYQMTAPNPAGGHGSSGNAARQQPSNYGSSVGYNSQYDATGSSQNNVSDFVNNKGNSSSGSFGNTQGQNKGPGTSSNVPTQNCTSNAANSDIPVNIYAKSHVSLSKSYDKQPFHAGGPGSFSSTGGAGGSGTLSNVGNAVQGQNNGPYGPHMYVPTGNVPHHMHPNPHHQDGSSTGDRSSASFFRSNYR